MKSFKKPLGKLHGRSREVDSLYNQLPVLEMVKFSLPRMQAKMKQWGLSETETLDVYHHGSIVKNNMMVRKYYGYEIGIWFFADRVTGKAIISSAWKRGRR